MVLYPEVQKLAQDELGSVVPQDRLPDFSDRESLPYIQALILELLRWMPVAPLGGSRSTVMNGNDLFELFSNSYASRNCKK